MAEALIGGLLSANLYSVEQIRAADPDSSRCARLNQRFGISTDPSNQKIADWGTVVVLAIKPQVTEQVLRELDGQLAGKLVVSVVAGWSIRRIMSLAGAGACRVIRAMPNTPVLVKEGVTALSYGPDVGEAEAALVRRLFEAVGKVVSVEERLMDAVTGLSGSGPAYLLLAIEALTDGGVKMGLPREVASLLAAQTVLGVARMVLETGEHPACLRDRVVSPGGTTIAGLYCLERAGMRAALIEAVEAATKRSQELGH